MNVLSPRSAYVAAAVSGVALWGAATIVSGRTEAWDSPLYWVAAYPAGIVVSFVLGYLAPERPWRWAVTLMWCQAATLAVLASSFGLLPLGLILFGVLALPPAGAASVAGVLRRRLARAIP